MAVRFYVQDLIAFCRVFVVVLALFGIVVLLVMLPNCAPSCTAPKAYGLECVVQFADALETQQQPALSLSCQPKSRSRVFKRSSKMAMSNIGLSPRFGVFLPRGLGLMLGVILRLKMALRLRRQPYTPSRQIVWFWKPATSSLLGSAFYPVLVHWLAIYAPRFLPTLGHPRAVALDFARCDQLATGLAPVGVRPCWAHQ